MSNICHSILEKLTHQYSYDGHCIHHLTIRYCPLKYTHGVSSPNS